MDPGSEYRFFVVRVAWMVTSVADINALVCRENSAMTGVEPEVRATATEPTVSEIFPAALATQATL